MSEFEVKDSGDRRLFESGMQRDTDEGKVRWDLVADGPMLERYAIHLTKGAVKYDARNWMQANGKEEYDRFRESAFRHFMQWYNGAVDEDHASAVWFNINGAEYVNAMRPEERPMKEAYDKAVVQVRGQSVVMAGSEGETLVGDDWQDQEINKHPNAGG
jgi:hypothetical protein